jgi:hypothetical protein
MIPVVLLLNKPSDEMLATVEPAEFCHSCKLAVCDATPRTAKGTIAVAEFVMRCPPTLKLFAVSSFAKFVWSKPKTAAVDVPEFVIGAVTETTPLAPVAPCGPDELTVTACVIGVTIIVSVIEQPLR